LHGLGLKIPQIELLQRCERRLDSLTLLLGDQTGEHVAEVRVLGA
jgi:hypothetical protein